MRPADGGVTGRVTRRVLAEREMRSRAHVVRDVVCKHAVQSRRVHHDHVIEALASDRADDALHVGVGVSRALHLVMRISHTFSPSRIRSIRCTARRLSC